MFDVIPSHIDFDVSFEPTKMEDKKYVVNAETDEYLGIVGDTFQCASHPVFFKGVQDTIVENKSSAELEGAQVKWKTARKGAWAMMDITLPNVTATITTSRHETVVAERIIALHGIDGSCSNIAIFGAIDFFCTNGQIRGKLDTLRKKNTSNFNMSMFVRELRRSKQDFYARTEELQTWANKPLDYTNVRDMLHVLMGSERTGDKMLGLYAEEAKTRGHNVWALYSAFTNYATYADQRNGFELRKTGKDTAAVTMFDRENKVAGWIESKPFQNLIAA